jgi:hypothetical protein
LSSCREFSTMLAAIPFWDAGCAGLKRHLRASSCAALFHGTRNAKPTGGHTDHAHTRRFREGPGFSANIPRLVGATSGSAV